MIEDLAKCEDRLQRELLGSALIEPKMLDEAVAATRRSGQRLGKILMDLGAMSPDQLYQLYSKICALPVWDGEGEPLPEYEVLDREFLAFNRVLPVRRSEDEVWLTIDDPEDDGLIDLLNRLLPGSQLSVCPPARLTYALDTVFGGGDAAGDDVGSMDVEQLKDLALEAPIIRQVNELIGLGIEIGASDIHLEPFKSRIELRYRVDGVLHNRPAPRMEDYPAVVSRLKIIAGMDIAERRLPQDGRIRTKGSGRNVDIRVSTIPTLHGEDVVLRILDQGGQSLTLDSVGLSPGVLEPFRAALARSHGLLVVTGPTGSGKTTTLYSGLASIVDGRQKIITVEDPVEYEIPGVNQIQVNEAAGMGFANALRSILRHDPDVIFIGEIRDRETAEIAVQSSLTGHLVLSTLHTNSAAGAIGRFLDMGIADYLLASSLIGITAQRLVRMLCKHCRQPVQAEASFFERFGIPAGQRIFEAAGCPRCARTGYSGRLPIGEFLGVDARLRDEILRDPSLDNLARVAADHGHRTLLMDGVERVMAGDTSLDEILRVAG